MRFLKNCLVAGIIGAGSLIGFNGYGQEKIDNKYTIIMLNTLDRNFDGKVDKYTLWFDYQGRSSLTYADEDFDGKIDSYNYQIYPTFQDKIIEWESGRIEDNESESEHKGLLMKLKNFSKGNYYFCKEKYCDKTDILDCLIDLF